MNDGEDVTPDNIIEKYEKMKFTTSRYSKDDLLQGLKTQLVIG